MKNLLITFLLIFNFQSVLTQTNGKLAIKLLQDKLFPVGQDSISVIEMLGCKNVRLDSIYFVQKEQPVLSEILEILVEISFTKDTSLIKDLQILRSKYISIFEKKWEPLLLNGNFSCKAAAEKFTILEALEEANHSLSVHSLTTN